MFGPNTFAASYSHRRPPSRPERGLRKWHLPGAFQQAHPSAEWQFELGCQYLPSLCVLLNIIPTSDSRPTASPKVTNCSRRILCQFIRRKFPGSSSGVSWDTTSRKLPEYFAQLNRHLQSCQFPIFPLQTSTPCSLEPRVAPKP